VQEYRDTILKEYTDSVLTAKVLPNPPVRGRYGYAYIPLKEGAIPRRQKPFRMRGEKGKKHEKGTEDWLKHGYLEPPVAIGTKTNRLPVEIVASEFCRRQKCADLS